MQNKRLASACRLQRRLCWLHCCLADCWQRGEDPAQGGRRVLWRRCRGGSRNQGRTEAGPSAAGGLGLVGWVEVFPVIGPVEFWRVVPRPASSPSRVFFPLQVLTQLVNVNLRVFMNCQSKLSEMPLKRWEPKVSFLILMATVQYVWVVLLSLARRFDLLREMSLKIMTCQSRDAIIVK